MKVLKMIEDGEISPEEGAALPLAGLTAYNALINKGNAEADMDILISGVGGGVAEMVGRPTRCGCGITVPPKRCRPKSCRRCL